MDTSIAKDRLNEAFVHLRDKGVVSTQKDIANAMSSYPANISRAFKGDEKYLTQKFLIRFNHTFGDIFNPSWLEGEEEFIKFRNRIDIEEIQCYYNESTRCFHANGDNWPSFEDGWYQICRASFVKWDPFRSKIYNLVNDPQMEASNQMVKELWIDYNYSYNSGVDSEWQPPESILENFRNTSNIDSSSANNCTEKDYSLVPLINIDSVGGMDSPNILASGDQFVERLIPFTGALEGDRAIYQSGDSMTPTIPAGSVLQIRRVDDWREYFGYGGIFVLWLKDNRRITKQVKKYSPDPQNFVTCHSFNPDSADEELPKKFIREVWKVIKVLTDKGW